MSHPKGTQPGRSLGIDYSPGLGMSHSPPPPALPGPSGHPGPTLFTLGHLQQPWLNAGPGGTPQALWVWEVALIPGPAGTNGASWGPKWTVGMDTPGTHGNLSQIKLRGDTEDCLHLWCVTKNSISNQ